MTAETATKPAILRETRIAAKDYVCADCGQTIHKGERHERRTLRRAGALRTLRLHYVCPVNRIIQASPPLSRSLVPTPWPLRIPIACVVVIAVAALAAMMILKVLT